MANLTNHGKGEKFPAEPLTKEEVLALMDVCSRRAPTGRRDRALICLLWRRTAAISEALVLESGGLQPQRVAWRCCTARATKPA